MWRAGHAAGFLCGLTLGLLMAPKFVIIREPRVPDKATTLSAWSRGPTSPSPDASPDPSSASPENPAEKRVDPGLDAGEGSGEGGAPDQSPDLWQTVVVDQTTSLQRVWGVSLGVLAVGALFAAGLISRGTPGVSS